MTRSETERIALAKGLVYLHFGFRVPETFDVRSRTADPLHATHVATHLNRLATTWLPTQLDNRYRWVLLQPDDVRGLTPAWKIIRLCAAHIIEAPGTAQDDDESTALRDLEQIDAVDLSALREKEQKGMS